MKSLLRILALALVVSPVLAAPPTPSEARPTAGDDPKADAPVTFERAVSYWVHGAIGAKALPDGGIRLVDCYDEGLWSARLGPMGAKLAHGFDGPGYKIERALGRDGVEQRFVALAKTGAFGKGPDLTDAWQAWILKDGADTLRRESNHFAQAIMLAGLKLGADLSYTPDASAETVNSGVPRVDLEPAPAPAFPVDEVYSASRGDETNIRTDRAVPGVGNGIGHRHGRRVCRCATRCLQRTDCGRSSPVVRRRARADRRRQADVPRGDAD
jgi:hypothetical protein